MTDIKPLIEEIIPIVKKLRQDIHAHPEPGYHEFETSAKIIKELEDIPGIEIRKNVAATGVVATLCNNKPGPCVALRADMDCLPLQEMSKMDYASKRDGYMHACGHDGHTACLVGAALVLSKIQDELQGPVKFIFQPAEERGGAGGLKMCREGVLTDPKVSAIYGFHCYPGPDLKLGDIAVRQGPAMAGGRSFKITIHGKGGHAAFPDICIDPIHIGMKILNALYGIPSESIETQEDLILSITEFHSGTSSNIIPEMAVMGGTIRSFSSSLLESATTDIQQKTEQIALESGAKVTIVFNEGYPVLMNHPETTTLLENVAQNVLKKKPLKMAKLLASEDFSYYTQEIPGSFWFLGTRPKNDDNYPICHHSKFDFNDDAIGLGIEMHCEIARCFAANWED